MAFPTSPSNNQVHKEGNRSFSYDSTAGVWDRIAETDRFQRTGLFAGGEVGELGSNFKFPQGALVKTTSWKDVSGNYSSTGSTPKTMIDSVPHTLVATRTYVVRWRFFVYGKMTSSSHTYRRISMKFQWGGNERLQGTTPSDDVLSYHDLGRDLRTSHNGNANSMANAAFDCVIPYGTSGTKHFFVTMHGAGSEWYVQAYASPNTPYFFFIDEYEGDIYNFVKTTTT